MATPIFLFPMYAASHKNSGKKDRHHKKIHPFKTPRETDSRLKRLWKSLYK